MKRKQPSTASIASSESGRVARVQPQKYEEQLEEKVQSVREMFDGMRLPEIEVFRSPDRNYRLRCEFRVWHEGDVCYYAMFEKEEGSDAKPKLTRKDTFPAASLLVNELMVALMSHVHRCALLKNRLYQAAFHTTLSGDAMITLVYHKALSDDWKEVAEKLALDLAKEAPECLAPTVNIIGRSRKQKIVIGNDFVKEELKVNGRSFVYKQVEGCFSQPNGHVCSHMLSWAQRVSTPKDRDTMTDLLELYCGNCNFTIPLSFNFRKVIATEVSRTSVDAGTENLQINAIHNVLLARMSSEEFVEKWRSGDLGKRLHHHKASDFVLSSIFVDPPRAGLDSETVELLQQFESVLYISCNPVTLHANISAMTGTHYITHFALFDQFPYTGHIECGVYLNKRKD